MELFHFASKNCWVLVWLFLLHFFLRIHFNNEVYDISKFYQCKTIPNHLLLNSNCIKGKQLWNRLKHRKKSN